MNTHFAPGHEFSLIETLFDASHFSNNGKGLGDDGFLLEIGGETWVISTDSSVEGIHYRLDWVSPEAALEKALLSNLSDINAMGGQTTLVFFNLGALQSWDHAQILRLGATIRKMETEFGFRVVGGDTVTKTAGSFFTFTVMGRIQGKPLLRSAAIPGHQIYMSGRLGGSAAGLSLLNQGIRLGAEKSWDRQIAAHVRPQPPLKLGPRLSKFKGPVSAIDISDGLSSELGHLSKQSGCRLLVEWSKLTYDRDLVELPRGEAWREWVLNGGEEYQLLFTGNFSESELNEIEVASGSLGISQVGTVKSGQGVGIVNEAGVETELMAKGWSH